MTKAKSVSKSKAKPTTLRQYNVRPDTLDFRDVMYVANLVEVPTRIDLDSYREVGVPILDQKNDGACSGFGLATVAHYLLRKRQIVPNQLPISPRMLYEMAKRYDEWAGEDYEGSSARGAMKGWHKHGVCSDTLWPYQPKKKGGGLTEARARAAASHPLGAYYRVTHKDIVAMHAAITEVGILYATATVHAGWDSTGADGIIHVSDKILGGHAFALVAYDERGFWIQNSWGNQWGKQGFGQISYADWLANGTDVWVARLAVPIIVDRAASDNTKPYAGTVRARSYSLPDLRPHIISIGNNGQLRPTGPFGTSAADVEEIILTDFVRTTMNWPKKRLLLYAHGGLVDEDSAIQRIADYRKPMLDAQIYPLAFIWKTDYWTTLKNMLEDALSRRRPEGFIDSTKDFMLDRLDDALEPIARLLTGKAEWSEMKQNGVMATTDANGGARIALGVLKPLLAGDDKIEIHIAGHSAGGIFHAPLVQFLTSSGVIASGPMKGVQGLAQKIKTCTLWAPAVTTALFEETYLPAINSGAINRFALFTLTDKTEQDDNCANIYHKSLLYLVSNAFEERAHIPIFRDGEPLLGMEKFVNASSLISKLFSSGKADWIRAPNAEPNTANHSEARHHGDFDDDQATIAATIARILNHQAAAPVQIYFKRTATGLRHSRMSLNV